MTASAPAPAASPTVPPDTAGDWRERVEGRLAGIEGQVPHLATRVDLRMSHDDSGVQVNKLRDGQRVEVDVSHARRCLDCGRLRHFVTRSRCEDCAAAPPAHAGIALLGCSTPPAAATPC